MDNNPKTIFPWRKLLSPSQTQIINWLAT